MSDTPTRIGPYAIERRLGAGGMAETFVAVRRMQSIEQRVCLKRILPAYARNSEARRLFSREANISARLRHANLVQVLDVGEDNGTPYLVMELVEGCDLDHVLDLAPNRKLSPELVGYVLAEMSHGLHEAHGGDGAHGGVVHRDLSPSNVLLSMSGEVKVADFGIAKALTGDKATATSMRGKFGYMAPEQLDGAPLDPRADMFALGVMGFEMLAGVRPFEAEADARLVLLIAKNERKSIDELVPDAPKELRETIEALLSPVKEKRPQNGHAVVEQLAPMLPSAVVARRQLGKLVTAAHEMRLAAAARGNASDPAYAATSMAGAPASAPPTNPSATEASGTPMVITALPSAAAREPTTERSEAPRAARASESRANWMVGGLIAFAIVAVLAVGGVFLFGRNTPPETTLASSVVPPTSIASTPAPSVAPALPPPAPPTTVAVAITAPEATTVSTPPPRTRVGAHPPRSSVPATPVETPPVTTAADTAREGSGAGHVHIVASPWGMIWIDGRFMGRAPIDAQLHAGSHRVAAGFEQPTVTRTIRVRAGQDERVELEVSD